MSEKILAMDIGGTAVKFGIVSENGDITEVGRTPIDSSAAADQATVLKTFSDVIASVATTIDGIGVCIPGPFDYHQGVSLMTHKFKCLLNVNLKTALRRELPELDDKPIHFRHDGNAFLAGELWRGAAAGAKRAIGVCLGTGISVSCFADGQFINDDLGGPADEISVWNRTFRDGVVEDYISTRALVAEYIKMVPSYDASLGVKGIAEAAKSGSSEALSIFQHLGEALGEALHDIVFEQKPEVIVFGGQVAKAFSLFEEPFREPRGRNEFSCGITKSQLGDCAPLCGVAVLFFGNKRQSQLQKSQRPGFGG